MYDIMETAEVDAECPVLARSNVMQRASIDTLAQAPVSMAHQVGAMKTTLKALKPSTIEACRSQPATPSTASVVQEEADEEFEVSRKIPESTPESVEEAEDAVEPSYGNTSGLSLRIPSRSKLIPLSSTSEAKDDIMPAMLQPSPRSGPGAFRPGDKVIFWSEEDRLYVEAEVTKAVGSKLVATTTPEASPAPPLAGEVEVGQYNAFWVPAHTPSAPSSHMRRVCEDGVYCNHRSKAHLRQMAHLFDRDYDAACAYWCVEASTPSLWLLFQWLDYDNSGKVSQKEFADQLPLLSHLMHVDISQLGPQSFKALDQDGNDYLNFGEFTQLGQGLLQLPLGLEHLGLPLDGAVPFPEQWASYGTSSLEEVAEMYALGDDMLAVFQEVVARTYSSTWTRDRRKHNPTAPNVPTGYKVTRAYRSENSRAWRSYSIFRASCRQDRRLLQACKYDDIKTVLALKDCAPSMASGLADDCNEWYLWHGTHAAKAGDICSSNFRMSRCGENTGTLYGNGTYFSECITKADEYAKSNDEGEYCVLLCRLLGGNVRYTAEVEPDPTALAKSCMDGEFDSVLGDREKCRGTYREFVFFDSEHIYPEFVVCYKRLT